MRKAVCSSVFSFWNIIQIAMACFYTNNNITDVSDHMKKLSSLISSNKCLIDTYISEYFTKEVWKCVNERWWQCLLQEDPENLATLLSPEVFQISNVWPLSLLALRKASHSLALERKPSTYCTGLIQDIRKNKKQFDDNDKEDHQNGSTIIKDGQYLDLEHCYRRHVKPKKQHEITTLAKVIDGCCRVARLSHVVDVGAGQGHLSRLLSYGYKHHVTTLDADSCHIPKAHQYDKQVKKDISLGRTQNCKKTTDMGEGDLGPEPCHAVVRVAADLTSTRFTDLIRQSVKDNKKRNSDFLVTGLHACGDLTPALLSLFLHSQQARCLVSVSCCYMKLTTTSNTNGCSDRGYPMSKFGRTGLQCPLSYEAREMACHFVDAYRHRLLENGTSLRAHVYRAALQEIIVGKSLDKVHDSIKLTFKRSHHMPFSEYCRKALCRLGLDEALTEEQLSQAEGRLKQWREVVAFYTLRLSLAPLVESLLLLDRLLFLLENGVNCGLVPIFDPALSPRNFAIVAFK